MPQDPLPHPSSNPHHAVSPRSAPVPFPTGSSSPPPIQGLTSTGNTPPTAGPINKPRQAGGGPKDTIPMAKTPRKQRSSRFHVTERVELERLPGFMGAFAFAGSGHTELMPCDVAQRFRCTNATSSSFRSCTSAQSCLTSTTPRPILEGSRSRRLRSPSSSSGSRRSGVSSPRTSTPKSSPWCVLPSCLTGA